MIIKSSDEILEYMIMTKPSNGLIVIIDIFSFIWNCNENFILVMNYKTSFGSKLCFTYRLQNKLWIKTST